MSSPEAIGFLTEALGDSTPSTWKVALSGLVKFGGPEARSALEAVRRKLLSQSRDQNRIEWIDEAIEQVAG